MHFTRQHLKIVALFASFSLLGSFPVASAQTPPTAGSALTPEQKLELAMRKIDAEDFREAERLIGEVTVEKPKLPRLMLVRGLYFNAMQRYTDAISDLEKFNGTTEGRREWRGLATVGDLYLKSKMWRAAELSLQLAKDVAPVKENGKSVKADILLSLASAQLGLQNFKSAVQSAKEAQQISPEVGEVHLRLAQIALSAGDVPTAQAAVDKAIFQFKNDVRDDAFNRSAHDQLRSCYDILAAIFQNGIRNDADNAENYSKYSQLLLEASQIDRRRTMLDALQLVRQAIERAPKRIDLKLNLVRLEYELGGVKDAKDMLEDVLRQDPKNADALEFKQKFESSPPRPSLS